MPNYVWTGLPAETGAWYEIGRTASQYSDENLTAVAMGGISLQNQYTANATVTCYLNAAPRDEGRVQIGSVTVPRGGQGTLSLDAELAAEMPLTEGRVYIKFESNYSSVTLAATEAGTFTTVYRKYEARTVIAGGGGLLLSDTAPRPGDTVTVRIDQNTGYNLGAITADTATLSGSGSTRTFTMPHANVTITAAFVKTSYSITRTVTPSGGGTLTASRNSATYQDKVTLKATPAAGYTFAGFSTTGGSISRSGNTGTLTMPAANVTVTATFTKISYSVSLAVNPSGSGTLTADRATATVGDTVNLTPAAATGYRFTGYTKTGGSISGNRLTMPAGNVTVTANFEKITYAVSRTVNPAGGGTLTADRNTANYRGTVNLTATPAAGYSFTGFTTTGGTIARSGNNGTLTMPAADVTVTANFAKISYSVTTAVNPGGGGTLTASRATATVGDTVALTPTAATGYRFTGYTKTGGSISGNTLTMPAANVTVTANFEKIDYTITRAVSPSGGGSLKADRSKANYRDTVTLTPTPATGYRFTGYTTTGGSISGNRLTMPAANVTVTANFAKISYSITMKVNPAGAGTASAAAAESTYGEKVALSQTPAEGFHFTGWSATAGSVGGNTLTMPAVNVTVTANYTRRSTPSLNSRQLQGGGSVTLGIAADKTAYTHKYRLYFGSGMDTGVVDVAAGVSNVVIAIPEGWSDALPNAASKTGGWLRLWTYSGSTLISGGYSEITGLVYNVPAGVVPSLSNPAAAIARTIGGKTYANVGNYYVQNHCGVTVTATAAGTRSATIASIRIKITGYTGSAFNKTYTYGTASAALSHTSGLLSVKGRTTITVTATDSRGRTTTKTATITVTEYAPPGGTLDVWRVDGSGTADTSGQYGQYSLTTKYTRVGNNALSVIRLACGSHTADSPAAGGNLMPSGRITFNVQQQYTVTLTLTDAFETTVVQAVLPSARFIIFVSADGNKIGFMKAADKSVPSGKQYTFEISGDSEIYIGDRTLKQYIQDVVNGQI